MTDLTPPAGEPRPEAASGAAPGWYPTAPSSPTLRWWDGMQWTEHLRNQQDFEPPAVSTITSLTPVYTVFIWLYTLLPLVSVLALIPVDLTGMVEQQVRQSIANPRVGSTGALFGSPGYVLLQVLSVVSYAAMVVLAYFDWKRLGRLGFARRFHWAWAFVTAVYLIGRSVVVHKESGRGLAVVVVYISIVAFSLIVAVVKASQLIGAMEPLVQQYR
ncbi:DUF2510 domain-containing protein [Subtercola sp. Z020]|uniref:DUF2510 domain-containing protein n=1 Tax=Subtercola sp. Z020 TaxID=2080582 RepID=UPI00130D5435|nr:DUF2510 domain-containing protein [Subtercola sp. Z020]